MQDDANGRGHAGSAGSGGNDRPSIPDVNAGPAPVAAKPRKRVRAGVFVVAAAAFTAVGFGASVVIRDQIAPAASSAVAVSTGASGRSFTPAIGNVVSTDATMTIGGHHLAGLLRTTAQLIPGQGAGGPLVNLSGQVIDIDLTRSARGASVTGYAVPINEALAVAAQLKH